MNSKEQILQEMTAVPEPILAEVLDFLRFLKSKQLQSSPSVTIVSPFGKADGFISSNHELGRSQPRLVSLSA